MFVVLAGCGSSPGTVTGKVTYQGKNLKGGSVAFISTDGQRDGGTQIKEDGTYEILDLAPGKYKITVDTESLVKTGSGDAYAVKQKMPPGAMKMGPPPGANVPDGYKASSAADAEETQKQNAKRYVKIPTSYGKTDTSGLEYTVVAGPQTHNIELK